MSSQQWYYEDMSKNMVLFIYTIAKKQSITMVNFKNIILWYILNNNGIMSKNIQLLRNMHLALRVSLGGGMWRVLVLGELEGLHASK